MEDYLLDYRQYKCDCGSPAAKGKNIGGIFIPQLSKLSKRPVCWSCKEKQIARYKGFSSYTEYRNSLTYRGKKYKDMRCMSPGCPIHISFWEEDLNLTKKILQVDHIDGDPSNNHEDNLMTICPTCHTKKTLLSKDSHSKGRRKMGIKYPGKIIFK